MHVEITPEPIIGDAPYQAHEPGGVENSNVFSFMNLIYGHALTTLDDGKPHEITTPKNIKEALTSPQRSKWIESIKEEYQAMVKYETFAPLNNEAKLALETNSIKVHGTRVVFAIKRNDRGEIVRYKSRLVVQGYTMEPGIDFDSTFSPVAWLNSIRMITALACMHKLEMIHTDVPNAYLNGKATKLVLVKLPEMWNDTIGPSLGPDGTPVMMMRSVYGTPDAGKNWNTCIHKFFILEGFIQCKKEPCIYTKGKLPTGTIIGMWVDDNYIISGDIEERNRLIRDMEKQFNVKNLGIISFSLGLHFHWTNQGLMMSQTAYIEKIATKFKMEGCKPLYVPMQKEDKPTADMSPKDEDTKKKMAKIPYRNAIGSLLYLAICTRPDICYVVSALARFSHNPGERHWKLVQNIIRYVVHTKNQGLFFKLGSQVIENMTTTAYCDASFNDTANGKSTLGYIMMLSDCYPISWRSKLTTVTSQSTMETELMAIHALAKETVWTRMVLEEISSLVLTPTTIYCDNSPAIQATKEPRVTERNKHIRYKFFYVADLVRDKEVSVVKIRSEDQVADILTKPIANPQFSKLRFSLCVRNKGEE
jgi:hypothetical protein